MLNRGVVLQCVENNFALVERGIYACDLDIFIFIS